MFYNQKLYASKKYDPVACTVWVWPSFPFVN